MDSQRARRWFNGLTAAIQTLPEHPSRCPATPEARCPPTPEDPRFRHLLYSRKEHVYWVIYGVDPDKRVVTVRHIRHGSRRPLVRARLHTNRSNR